MRKTYIKPEIKVISFKDEAILTESGFPGEEEEIE